MAGGRDQLGPLERVTRVVVALVAAEPRGVSTSRLLDIAAFGGRPAHHLRQLTRLIDDLNQVGWDIRNTAPPGQTAVYRVFARDNRLRMYLSPEQQAELARAALIAGDPGFAERVGVEPTSVPDVPALLTRPAIHGSDDALNKVLYALEFRCLLRFVYKQRPRVVHPHFVQPGPSGWHLVGHEDGGERDKQFITDRMSGVTVDLPGTAAAHHEPHPDSLDPLTWSVDPAVDVVVETLPEHRAQVELLLGNPTYSEIDDDVVRLTMTVTHRAAFRKRIYELGHRVRVVEPTDIRDELVAELLALAA